MKGLVVYLCGIATIAAIILCKGDSLATTGCVAALGAVILAADWSTRRLVVYAFVFAFAAVTEALFVHAGVWTYPYADIAGIPFWIPFVWANGAFFFIELSDWSKRQFSLRRI
jgi:hypothetical protein